MNSAPPTACLLFHKWTKWEQYDWRGMIRRVSVRGPEGESMEITERRQRRRCEVCNKEQDELVRNG